MNKKSLSPSLSPSLSLSLSLPSPLCPAPLCPVCLCVLLFFSLQSVLSSVLVGPTVTEDATATATILPRLLYCHSYYVLRLPLKKQKTNNRAVLYFQKVNIYCEL